MDTHSELEFTLELQSRVAPSKEYVTNMVPTQKAIPEEGRWKKTSEKEQLRQSRAWKNQNTNQTKICAWYPLYSYTTFQGICLFYHTIC